uniref:Uncharacterized protein n=1 Tax=Sphaerodactylus townsendi TaxID=933632 RepID=A0ACB8EX06_9SAUR
MPKGVSLSHRCTPPPTHTLNCPPRQSAKLNTHPRTRQLYSGQEDREGKDVGHVTSWLPCPSTVAARTLTDIFFLLSLPAHTHTPPGWDTPCQYFPPVWPGCPTAITRYHAMK